MDWLIVGLLIVILVLVVRLSRLRTLLNAAGLIPLAEALDRIESKFGALHEEMDELRSKMESIESAVGYCDQSISHLNKRFNRVDPYYRQEVDPHGLLDDETLFGLKKK